MDSVLSSRVLSAGIVVALGCSGRATEAEYTHSDVAGWTNWDEAAALAAAERQGDEQQRSTTATELGRATASEKTFDVRVEQSLAQFCDVPQPSAFFEFDSSELRGRAPSVLDRVADCLNSGTLRERRIVLVGHDDPRGSDRHDAELAASRAERVADYLASRGVARSRIDIVARSEEAASEREEDHVFDRSVDIQLVDR